MSETFDPYHKWLGIPPDEQPPNHYRLLGIAAFETDRDVIQMGVDRQMLLLRSLQSGKHPEHCQRILSEISAAKLCLLERDSKAEYDQSLHVKFGLPEENVESSNGGVPADDAAQDVSEGSPRAGSPRAVVPPRPGQAADSENAELESGEKAGMPLAPPPEDVSAQPNIEVVSLTRGSRKPLGAAGAKSGTRHRPRQRKNKSSWAAPVTWAAIAACTLAAVVVVISAKKGDEDAASQDPEVADPGDVAGDLVRPRKSTKHRPQAVSDDSNTGNGGDDAIPKPGDFVIGQPLNPKDTKPKGTNPKGTKPKSTGGDPRPTVEPTDPVQVKPAGKVVYLDDLTEQASQVFPTAKLGKHGATGLPEGMPQECRFQGDSVGHALSMQPPTEAASYVVFQLGGSYRDFLATVGLLEKKDRESTGVPLTFKVIGDGRQLWASSPIQQESAAQSFQISVRGVQRLRLEVDCPGMADAAWAVWINPKLTIADRPSSRTPGPVGSVVSKQPQPDEAAQKKARAQITRGYRDAISQARTSELKRALAQNMLQAVKAANDSAERFSLLDRAADYSAKGGDAAAAMEIVDRIDRGFQVDKLKMKAALLATVGQNSEGKEIALASRALALIDEAVLSDQYEMAERLGAIALTAARKTRDSLLIKSIVDRNGETELIASDHAAAAEAFEILKGKPDDPEANQVAGRFLCMVKGDWDGGLPLLAKAADVVTKELAVADTQGTGDPVSRVKLGNRWWDLAQEEKGLVKKNLELWAAQWYRLAVVELTGEAKQDVELRIAEIEERYRGPELEQVAQKDPTEKSSDRPKDVHENLGYALKPHHKDAVAFKDHWYMLVKVKGHPWREAQQRCQEMGGYLVCVGSEAEAKFIAKQTKTKNEDNLALEKETWLRVWLGAVRTPSGQWRWINGERNGFSYWAKSQPDNGLGNENRLRTGNEGRWHDAPDAAQNTGGFICEWEF
ncbi:MAG: NPCBM/NEW2 domain-containing protein [Pirellulales bacterium]